MEVGAVKRRPGTGGYVKTLTFKALGIRMTCGRGWAGRQLTPFHLLAVSPSSVWGAVTDEIVPHGITQPSVEAGVDLARRETT